MKVTILSVGKIKEAFFRDAIEEYIKRSSRFSKIEIIEVKDQKIPDNPSQKECEAILKKEGSEILSKIPNNAYVISMCIEGKELSSIDLSKKIDEIKNTNDHIVFIIGGSLGLSQEVKRNSDLCISFGKITLPHQLMRVVLLEQIYRAFKISANENYHK